MTPPARRHLLVLGLLTLALLVLPPFQVALEIHHEFAAADHDGHQHSDTDLCKWVQQHTAGSLAVGLPVVGSFVVPTLHVFHAPDLLRSVRLATASLFRGPPLS
jgi:hypothetical protein